MKISPASCPCGNDKEFGRPLCPICLEEQSVRARIYQNLKARNCGKPVIPVNYDKVVKRWEKNPSISSLLERKIPFLEEE